MPMRAGVGRTKRAGFPELLPCAQAPACCAAAALHARLNPYLLAEPGRGSHHPAALHAAP
jgi:hypothetical protein